MSALNGRTRARIGRGGIVEQAMRAVELRPAFSISARHIGEWTALCRLRMPPGNVEIEQFFAFAARPDPGNPPAARIAPSSGNCGASNSFTWGCWAAGRSCSRGWRHCRSCSRSMRSATPDKVKSPPGASRNPRRRGFPAWMRAMSPARSRSKPTNQRAAHSKARPPDRQRRLGNGQFGEHLVGDRDQLRHGVLGQRAGKARLYESPAPGAARCRVPAGRSVRPADRAACSFSTCLA